MSDIKTVAAFVEGGEMSDLTEVGYSVVARSDLLTPIMKCIGAERVK